MFGYNYDNLNIKDLRKLAGIPEELLPVTEDQNDPTSLDFQGPLDGLEGPWTMKNGRVVYYDPKEGKYYDRRQDLYLSDDEARELNEARDEKVGDKTPGIPGPSGGGDELLDEIEEEDEENEDEVAVEEDTSESEAKTQDGGEEISEDPAVVGEHNEEVTGLDEGSGEVPFPGYLQEWALDEVINALEGVSVEARQEMEKLEWKLEQLEKSKEQERLLHSNGHRPDPMLGAPSTDLEAVWDLLSGETQRQLFNIARAEQQGLDAEYPAIGETIEGELSNGYKRHHTVKGDDHFPTGQDQSVSDEAGPASAKHGDNPMQKKTKVQVEEGKEIHRQMVYDYRRFLDESDNPLRMLQDQHADLAARLKDAKAKKDAPAISALRAKLAGLDDRLERMQKPQF